MILSPTLFYHYITAHFGERALITKALKVLPFIISLKAIGDSVELSFANKDAVFNTVPHPFSAWVEKVILWELCIDPFIETVYMHEALKLIEEGLINNADLDNLISGIREIDFKKVQLDGEFLVVDLIAWLKGLDAISEKQSERAIKFLAKNDVEFRDFPTEHIWKLVAKGGVGLIKPLAKAGADFGTLDACDTESIMEYYGVAALKLLAESNVKFEAFDQSEIQTLVDKFGIEAVKPLCESETAFINSSFVCAMQGNKATTSVPDELALELAHEHIIETQPE